VPLTIPASWQSRILKVHQTDPWAWLWQIEADATASARTVFQLTGYPQQIAFGGMTFYPIAMQQTAIELGSDGNLPSIDLTISNAARVLAFYFESGLGFMGRPATSWLVNTGDLAQSMRWDWRVAAATVTTEAAVVRMESPKFFERKVPQDRFNNARCRWRFGSEECGYVINAIALYTTCAKHVADCILRGNDMVNRNLPRLHPERFGGFLGIPES
jgi:phage-related protein